MLKTILRGFSYIFHLAIVLCGIILGMFGLFGSNSSLTMPMLPWEDPALSNWLFFGGLVGLLVLGLAISGKLRLPFRIWTVLIFLLLFRGFFLTSVPLDDSFSTAILITLGALLAIWGSWTSVRRRNA